MLSVTGTAAVINLQFTTGEIGLLNTTLPLKNQSSKEAMNSSQERQELERDLLRGSKTSIPKEMAKLDLDAETANKENTHPNGTANNIQPPLAVTAVPDVSNCAMCHIPYSKSSVPFSVHMKKCGVCK